ncbi:putative H/ACA RNA-protein complex component Nop10p [Thermococcus cleftensis]|uniref:Ribosome biogenesis protein Nop10 n=1 Tax=Thermococcus cleftensis (strain DSM 27260 / KACC 17922 / CL1) TaxID=163003 RepID=I3ZSI5_THECF|nr:MULTISPECIES: RNA-protein complex protein Nop10 [Thermococcus]AFL94669.1 putative H/ACA RNA-protein complex component Nop10p [Thermococcus cleftensis]NJE03492.1 RNA-protein complex protein Nop10 [Thermococcus sp. MV11]
MHFRIRKCPSCGRYTLRETCPVCGEKTKVAHPPRFSPEDPYGEYRRRLKREQLGLVRRE